jgi:Putative peptidoglycan-binding domain-containing protein
VKECQTLLEQHGYSVGSWGIDGDFGKDTLTAVMAFQKDHHLEVDGIVGPRTWAKLLQLPVADALQELRSSETEERRP